MEKIVHNNFNLFVLIFALFEFIYSMDFVAEVPDPPFSYNKNSIEEDNPTFDLQKFLYTYARQPYFGNFKILNLRSPF